MKHKTIFTFLALFLVFAIGNVTTMASEKDDRHDVVVKAKSSSKSSKKGQTITGHRVIRELAGDLSVVEFFTTQAVPDGKLWAVVPTAVLRGELTTVSFFWHGDDDTGQFDDNPTWLATRANRVERGNPAIFPHRPHSAHKNHRRSKRGEIATQMAVVRYAHENWGVNEVCLSGFSSGGIIAMAIAQRPPDVLPDLKVRAVRIASASLALKKFYYARFGKLPKDGRVYRQYDPVDKKHIKYLSPDVPVLIVHDPEDKIAPLGGITPYLKKAKKRGLDVTLVKVDAFDKYNHGTERALGRVLRESGNEKYRCY